MSEKIYHIRNHEYITPKMLKIFHQIMLIKGHYDKFDGECMGISDINFEKINDDKWIVTSQGTVNIISGANVIKTINNVIDKVKENWKNEKYTIDVEISGTYDDSKTNDIESTLKSHKIRKPTKKYNKFVCPEKMF